MSNPVGTPWGRRFGKCNCFQVRAALRAARRFAGQGGGGLI